MKQHLTNLWEMGPNHPYAIFVGRMYGLNGHKRQKRDFTEYVLLIRLESVQNLSVLGGATFVQRTVAEMVNFSENFFGTKNINFYSLVNWNLWKANSVENAQALGFEHIEPILHKTDIHQKVNYIQNSDVDHYKIDEETAWMEWNN